MKTKPAEFRVFQTFSSCSDFVQTSVSQFLLILASQSYRLQFSGLAITFAYVYIQLFVCQSQSCFCFIPNKSVQSMIQSHGSSIAVHGSLIIFDWSAFASGISLASGPPCWHVKKFIFRTLTDGKSTEALMRLSYRCSNAILDAIATVPSFPRPTSWGPWVTSWFRKFIYIYTQFVPSTINIHSWS